MYDLASKDSFSSDEDMIKEFIFPTDEAIMEAMNIDHPHGIVLTIGHPLPPKI